ncbi:conserved exported hypothetical protein [Vibrio chagasii]|uniref:hypothetical protein n=1 Tax=Vibrio TaxID=662 RepID=UPI001493698F|nr:MULTISPECIES: hypothetical protein [unclassified Vibrio]CAH6840322.1 conserved exported hypothetical protein [Vibrio chagasii]NOI37465.1 hypothetical protein [Vibrio sp. 070316B]NOI88663.1 hypothetical protein [Vibrio sp. 99K-1]CAH6849975.1 conserved exported hypothetical protein [Vibrio chagasii]CAH6856160.1 conserved exported hypothetical protein [Vibrio chagasii]
MTASNTSNSFTALFRRSLLIGLASIAPTLALANPSSDVLDIYNQAAQGNEELVEVAYERLNDTLQQDGATPLTLVYLGSTETLMGRDAFLPWNKMKYVEKGLSTIDKSLGQLKDEDQPIHVQPRVQGLPDSYLTRAMAAVTYTSLPDMFNHFDRGYDLFLSLLSEDEFQQQHFSATSWIYRYAITASIRAEDLTQAQTWLKHMEMADADNIETITAKALIVKAK